MREAPRQLLRAIPGLALAELPHSDICCGSAAFTTLHKRKASLELLVEKMRYASATNAQVIATSNRAAGYSLRAGAEMHHANQQALHVIELLDQVNTS